MTMNKVYCDNKPLIIDKVGNGSYLYHWGIEEVTDEEFKGYSCFEVTVWPPLTANKITEVVIAAMWDKNYEQKLLNEYNSAILGLYDDETAAKKKQAYIDFLQARTDLKAQVDSDCHTLGIG